MKIVTVTYLGTAKKVFSTFIVKTICPHCKKKISSWRKTCYFCKKPAASI